MNAPAERGREGVALVDDPARRDVAAVLGPVVGDRAEIAVGVRIVQRAVLGEALEVITALDHVERDVGAVAAAEGVAGRVEVEAPGVAAPLGEELEPAGRGDDSARSPCWNSWPRIRAVTVLPCAP